MPNISKELKKSTGHPNIKTVSNAIELTTKEITERAALYKNEFNQEAIHDRVLVLKVMPDDYEMQELALRLDLGNKSNAINNKEIVENDAFIETSSRDSSTVSQNIANLSTDNIDIIDKTEEVSHAEGQIDTINCYRIFVHSSWLALNSRFFRSLLFESGMTESSTREFSMKITMTDEDAFLLLLKSIYDPEVMDNLQIAQLVNVLRLSVKYDVRFSTIKAKRVLEASPLTIEGCELIIQANYTDAIPDLESVMTNVEKILLCAFKPLDETWESEKFLSLSKYALRFLLGSDNLVVQSENTVFIALMHWIEVNDELYGDLNKHSDLLGLVRYELMKPSYIHDVVRDNKIANKLEGFKDFYIKALTFHAMPAKRRTTPRLKRQFCCSKSPTFTWILYADAKLFSFTDDSSKKSAKSSCFWYYGFKMRLQLDLCPNQDETLLYLVIENLADDGIVEIVYEMDVKFGEGLHKSIMSDSYVFQGDAKASAVGNYPFDENYSLNEIKEILTGSSCNVAIIFEITIDKVVND